MARISEAERQWSQMDGKRCLMPREERLEPVDLQVRVDAALHEDAGAAHLLRLGDLGCRWCRSRGCSLRLASLALERAIEGAEGAVLRAEIGVVDVAVDNVGDDAFRVEAAAHRVGFHADADQIVRVEAVDRLFARDAHEGSLRLG